MELNQILLYLSAGIKTNVLIGLSYFFFSHWRKQEKRYHFDFPFLMGIVMTFFTLAKIYDLIMYVLFNDNTNGSQLDTPLTFWLAKIRYFILILTTFPYLFLMLIIWFGEKRKLQFSIVLIWFSFGIIIIIIANNLSQLQSIIPILTFLPIFLSIITYFIVYHQKRHPQINSLFLAIGWLMFMIALIIRPILSQIALSESIWGLSWLCEFIELTCLIIISLGFIKPANYHIKQERNNNTKNSSKIIKQHPISNSSEENETIINSIIPN